MVIESGLIGVIAVIWASIYVAVLKVSQLDSKDAVRSIVNEYRSVSPLIDRKLASLLSRLGSEEEVVEVLDQCVSLKVMIEIECDVLEADASLDELLKPTVAGLAPVLALLLISGLPLYPKLPTPLAALIVLVLGVVVPALGVFGL